MWLFVGMVLLEPKHGNEVRLFFAAVSGATAWGATEGIGAGKGGILEFNSGSSEVCLAGRALHVLQSQTGRQAFHS